MPSEIERLTEQAYSFFQKTPGDPLTPDEARKIKEFIWDRKKEFETKVKNNVRREKDLRAALGAVLEAMAHPTESYIEERLLLALNTRSMLIGRVRTQFEVGPYRLDMAFPDVKLCVEADGADYHTSPEDVTRDQRRTKYLALLGWTVIRFTGSQIVNNLYYCVDRVTTVYAQMCRDAGIEEPWEVDNSGD